LSAAVVECLAASAWPGNFRQLMGVLRSLQVLAVPGAMVGLDDLPDELRRPAPAPLADGAALSEIERGAMEQALEACEGNMSAAARRLGVSRSTLYRRLRPDG
jgi:transcriptional regulator of acetoin/glycerol metabolism